MRTEEQREYQRLLSARFYLLHREEVLARQKAAYHNKRNRESHMKETEDGNG